MMDSLRFDRLVKVLASRRPRRAALPLLAALGLGLADATEIGTAKTKNEKEIRICNCASADVATCKTQKKDKDKAKRTLRRNACAYKGRCTGVSGCATLAPLAPNPGFQCTNNNDCTGGLVCIRQQCTACTADFQCPGNLVCNLATGRCQNPLPGPGPVCPAQCPFCQQCNAQTGQCEVCPSNCTHCFTTAERETFCGENAVSWTCQEGCFTSDDCNFDPGFPHCLISMTDLFTNESLFAFEVANCPGVLEGGRCIATPECF
jgi:hypothetical protein